MAIRPTPLPRSVLALDVGRRRIGLAGCDPLGLTVTPLPALARGSFQADLLALAPLVGRRRVVALVVGLPLDRAGLPTAQAFHCRRYGERLARALRLPLAWVNEHSSSWEAGERHGLHGDRSGALDSAAAALLLEQWLREGPEPEPLAFELAFEAPSDGQHSPAADPQMAAPETGAAETSAPETSAAWINRCQSHDVQNTVALTAPVQPPGRAPSCDQTAPLP
jgi:putative Holliday junction resolvase